jgi:hypothetical protein
LPVLLALCAADDGVAARAEGTVAAVSETVSAAKNAKANHRFIKSSLVDERLQRY